MSPKQVCHRYGHVYPHDSMKCIYCGYIPDTTKNNEQTNKQTKKGGASGEPLVSSGSNEH